MPQMSAFRHYGLAFSLCLLSLFGCVTSPTTDTQFSPNLSGRRGLLWEARRGQQTVTIIGTMHVGVRAEQIPTRLWTRLDAADTIITEVDLAGMNPQLFQKYLLLKQPSNLESLLGPADWQSLRKIIQEAFPQIIDQQLRQMSVLAACSNLMLAEAQLADKSSADNLRDQISMDQAITDKARLQGKKMLTFESLVEQFEYLKQVFTLEQLRDMLKESSENRAYYLQLAASYKDDDSTAIDSMVASMPEQLRKLLLDDRNQNWERKLDQLLSPKHTLIAVGAAHLGGTRGLLKLLENRGFRLQALSGAR